MRVQLRDGSFDSFPAVTGTFSVMTASLLCVWGSWERHSQLGTRDVYPFKTDTKGDTLVVHVSINWGLTEIGTPDYLIHGR